MANDLAYLVAKALTSIFKKRPYIAFFIFLGIFIIVLGVWILFAKTQEERLFPIIALGFVLIVLAWYSRLIIHRWNIIKSQTYDQPEQTPAKEPEMAAAEPAQASQPAVAAAEPAPAASEAVGAPHVKPSVQASHVLLGAIASVVIAAPLVVIASLAMIFSPIIADEMVEGFALVVGLLLCLLIPVAAGLGALIAGIGTRRARQWTSRRLNRLALLTGGGTGFALGLIAMIVFYILIITPAP